MEEMITRSGVLSSGGVVYIYIYIYTPRAGNCGSKNFWSEMKCTHTSIDESIFYIYDRKDMRERYESMCVD